MSDTRDNEHEQEPDAPGGVSWALQQLGWFARKYVLWPIADSFRAVGDRIGRFLNSFRYRSPFAYIGATLAVTVTAGAVAAAFYFYQQSEETPESPVVAQAPAQPADTVVPTTNAPAAEAPAASGDEDTLKGVVPSFKPAARQNDGSGGKSAPDPEETLVKPSKTPDSPPLKVAHRFASTFVEYEVGEKSAARKLRQTSTAKLSKELRANPPKLPANGKVPKATVMNVVEGERKEGRMTVSVSLLRSGAASELRLGLTRTGEAGWRVSEVRG